ncbi:unnamed protein product [Urochloa decumbens]|uniref:No apical meristem-associated C-terminal domain-containing protein n=1 Tax=Urochloa decumbens TaxID=240449 RepID=A0ABC9GK67_9POAL
MSRQSRRTLAPPPPEIPSPATRLTMPPPPPLLPQSTPPPFPSIYGGPVTWFPPGTQQSMAPSSVPCWFPAVQQPGMAGGPRCLATSLGASTGRTPTPDQEEPDLQAWGSDSHPPGGFVNLLKKSTSNPTQVMGNGSSSQPINVGDDTNNGDCARTEKRLLWTKEEDLRLEPKWDAYLERLDEEIEPENRKFNVQEDVTQHFSLDDVRDERPIGGKKAKEQQKRKRKDEACIIDLEDELHKFVDAQNTANEGRKEMLETQRRVSSEKLEARKLAYLAAKEHKESTMLETYRSLMMQDTSLAINHGLSCDLVIAVDATTVTEGG